MRKLFALALIAMLALGLSVSLMSCGGAQQEATPAAEETPAETPPMDEMMPDTTMTDTTTMSH